MGKISVRVSYKGTDFKVFFTIALIYGRSIPGPKGYFCTINKPPVGGPSEGQTLAHIFKIQVS